MNSRLNKVYLELRKLCLDGFFVTSSTNISYLTEYPTRDAYLLTTPQKNFIFTDFRYLEEYKKNLKNFTIIKINDSVFDSLKELVIKNKIKKLGFESSKIFYKEFKLLKEKLGLSVELAETTDIVENLRQIKEKNELEKIKKAIDITIEAFNFAKKILIPGIKELDLAAEIERFIRYKGAVGSAFDIIITSGPRTSLPHAITSSKRLSDNEPILIDMGVSIDGYKSDLTRTLFLGKISPEFIKSYSFVRNAQEEALKKIKPGVSCSYIDSLARNYLAKKGIGSFFGHSLGHGIGLAVHENPLISSKNKQILKENMVFTIEPAIYLPEKFGIRIEDMVLVTKKGYKVLSGSLNK